MGLDFEMQIYEHYFEVMDVIEKVFEHIFTGLATRFSEYPPQSSPPIIHIPLTFTMHGCCHVQMVANGTKLYIWKQGPISRHTDLNLNLCPIRQGARSYRPAISF